MNHRLNTKKPYPNTGQYREFQNIVWIKNEFSPETFTMMNRKHKVPFFLRVT